MIPTLGGVESVGIHGDVMASLTDVVTVFGISIVSIDTIPHGNFSAHTRVVCNNTIHHRILIINGMWFTVNVL